MAATAAAAGAASAVARRLCEAFTFYRYPRWIDFAASRWLVFVQLYVCYHVFFFIRNELLTTFCTSRIVLSGIALDLSSMPIGLSQRLIWRGDARGWDVGHFPQWAHFVGNMTCVAGAGPGTG